MTEEEKQQLRLALAILSGREGADYLSTRKCEILGVEPNHVAYYVDNGNRVNPIQQRAEEIVFGWITKALGVSE